MPARILVLSASVGAGHMRAAEAVTLALPQLDPTVCVRHVDVLQLTNAVFRRLYGKAYLDLVNLAPYVLGYFYDVLDRPRSPKSTQERLRLIVERMNLGKFTDLLKEQPWDVVVNTHFMPPEIVASLRRRGKITTPQITVITDFDTHRLWVNHPTDRYCAGTAEGAAVLASWGVPRETINVTGIPIHPKFYQPADRTDCRRKWNMDDSRPCILQLAGGFGVGPVAKIFQGLLNVRQPAHIVVVCGKNPKTPKQLAEIHMPAHHKVQLMGFTDKIDELMCCADVIVSKPGGLTTSEVLACGAVMAVVNPIPGQESRNSDYLLENGAAIKINNIATMAEKIGKLLDDPARLEMLKQNAAKLAHPHAAIEIAKLALSYSGKATPM